MPLNLKNSANQGAINKQGLIALSVAVLLQGCSTASKDLSSSYVSPMQYQSHDCKQITGEVQRVQGRIVEVGGRLDQSAANDKAIAGVGMILFWPALFALGGTKAQEAEYSRLKGEYEALEQATLAKNCLTGNIKAGAELAGTGNGRMSTSDISTIERRLNALSDLHSRGLISDDELRTRRAKIIDDSTAISASPASPTLPNAPNSPAAQTAPEQGLRPGDRLRFIDRDGISNAVTGETVLVVDLLDKVKITFNGGATVIRRDGTPEVGQVADSYIYQFATAQRPTNAKFKIGGYSDIVTVQLQPAGQSAMVISGIPLQVQKYRISGFATSEIPAAKVAWARQNAGAEIGGELVIDSATGLVISLMSKSNHPDYKVVRQLVSITR